jgi:hypothetical protein
MSKDNAILIATAIIELAGVVSVLRKSIAPFFFGLILAGILVSNYQQLKFLK